MKRFWLMLPAACLLLTGCVVLSVFPFYGESDLVSSEPMFGKWIPAEDPNVGRESYLFRKWDAKGCWFEGTDSDGHTNLVGEAHLFQLGSNHYLDLAVDQSDGAPQLLRAHLVLKVSVSSSALEWQLLDFDWMNALLRKEPGKLSRQFQRDSNGVVRDQDWYLTASSRELRQFLKDLPADSPAWGEKQRWKRAP